MAATVPPITLAEMAPTVADVTIDQGSLNSQTSSTAYSWLGRTLEELATQGQGDYFCGAEAFDFSFREQIDCDGNRAPRCRGRPPQGCIIGSSPFD